MTDYNDSLLPYRVGGLLYAPAVNTGVARKIREGSFSCLTSVALCLEDAVMDGALEYAEQCLKNTVAELNTLEQLEPLIFVRIRTPGHLTHIHELLGEDERILTGYILPKFSPENAEEYTKLIVELNRRRQKRLYIMPIIESGADIAERRETLYGIKSALDEIREYVLNVRVGGNDLCGLWGLRRKASQSIYDIGVIRDMLSDIINVFASDYVVSGAVWEYFGSGPDNENSAWASGLKRELELDLLNGFIGKTAIHPSQLPIIFESMKPSRGDFDDAREILSWSENESGVKKSENKIGKSLRMNEVKCHKKWAERIVKLAKVYGVRNS